MILLQLKCANQRKRRRQYPKCGVQEGNLDVSCGTQVVTDTRAAAREPGREVLFDSHWRVRVLPREGEGLQNR